MSTDKTALHSPGKILRSTSVMASGTLLSRVLGFARDIIFARFFGTAASADAFVVAFRIPNLFRDLIGEGAANSSFVPVLTEYKQKKPQEMPEFLNAVLTWAFLILSAVTVMGIVLAPGIVSAIAPGFTQDPAKLKEATDLTRIMFPYLVFIGLTAFFSAIQFTHGSFAMPAFGPCLLNIALIVSTLLSVLWMKRPVYGLAAGVIVGGILQFYFQWLPVRKYGMKFGGAVNLAHPGARQVGRLLLPRIFGSGIYQLNLFVDTICASLTGIVGLGAISALYYATRIVQLPMGIFGVSLASASLPAFSSHAASGDREELKKTIAFALQNIFFIMLPMSVFLVLMAEPLIRVMLERGAFDRHSTLVTASVLSFSSLGLLGYGGARIMTTAFHAMQDTRTPVKVAVVCLVVNASLDFFLMFPMKVSGIALAGALSSTVNLGLLSFILRRRLGGFGGAFNGFFGKIFLAGLGEGLAVVVAWQWIIGIPDVLRISAVFAVGVLVYGILAVLLGVTQAVKVKEIIFKK